MTILLRVIAAILMLIAFIVVLLATRFYTVSHIRELTDAAWFFFIISFLPWKPLKRRARRQVPQ